MSFAIRIWPLKAFELKEVYLKCRLLVLRGSKLKGAPYSMF